MKSSFLIIVCIVLSIMSSAQISDKTLTDVYSTDSMNAWIVGAGGEILHTIDGGLNWEDYSYLTSKTCKSIDFSSETNGFIVGDDGLVLRTEDGGQNWTSIDFDVPNTLFTVDFVDENNGWIVQGFWHPNFPRGLYRTIDGGDNWSFIEINNLYRVSFIDSLNGWASIFDPISSYVSVHRTYDGGMNWIEISNPISLFNSGLAFIDSTHGVFLGSTFDGEESYDYKHKSTNGGYDWEDCINDKVSGCLCIIDTLNVWLGSSSGISFSDDFCETYQFCFLDYFSYISAISVHGINNGWAVGGSVDDGRVWKLHGLNDWVEIISTKVNESPERTNNIRIFPNPTSTKTTILFELKEKEKILLSIINIHGQKVMQAPLMEAKTGKYKIDCADFEPGIYFITLITDTEILTKNFIIE